MIMGVSRALDEIALKRAIQKADKTQRLIEGYKEAWDELETDLWEMWKSTKSDDQVKREEIFREHHACKALQAKLQKVVNAGKKAEEELNQEKLKHGNRNST
jgi:septal ring factor EnvC (AmiA/AmiB activator)